MIVLIFQGVPTTMVPKEVTGLKCYHLRSVQLAEFVQPHL